MKLNSCSLTVSFYAMTLSCYWQIRAKSHRTGLCFRFGLSLRGLGYSIFTPYRGMEVKFQGVLQKEFLGVKNP